MRPIILATLSAAAAAFAAGGAARAAEPFTLTSTTFQDGGPLPKAAAGNINGNANCVGQNLSPQLSWSNPPEGVKSFAIRMFDPEGALGLGAIHWVAYGIAPEVRSFAEGEAAAASPKYVGGKGSAGLDHFIGPCPPPGGVHHYSSTIIATDLDPGALLPGLTLSDLTARLAGHARAAAGIVGTFRNP